MKRQVASTARAEDVWPILSRHVRPGAIRELPVADALGRVLARDAPAAHDYPPFDRAMLDGYAVRSADLHERPARLRVCGLIRAGGVPVEPLAAGACWAINTGAPLPPGADAVVMVEKSRDARDGFVTLDDAPRPEYAVERRAAHLRAGDVVLTAPQRLRAEAIAALVAAGTPRVAVFDRPRVAVLTTGDEVVTVGAALGAGQIHDSNRVLLPALVRRAGGEIFTIEHGPDEPAALRDVLRRGLAADVLCICGGMSKGTHDFVPRLLGELGVRWLVDGLDLKPGKPTRIGQSADGRWVAGLPGNPVSCAVCFLLFVAPLLDGTQGLPVKPPPQLSGELETDLPAGGDRPMYQPAVWSAGAGGEVRVRPVAWRGSGDPFGMATANALLYRPARAPAAGRGARAVFLPFDGPQ